MIKQNSVTSLIFTVALAFNLLSGCVSNAAGPETTSARVKSTDGSPIAYGVQGQGEPAIVFVHCWTCNYEFWTKQIEYFSKSHQVIWLDLAGHGKSGSNRQNYTMQAFGEDVAAVVNQVGAKNVVLVGHSMGGPVIMEAAKRLGDRVRGIVGVDTFYTSFEYPTTEEKITEFVQPFEKDFANTSEQMVRSMFTPNADPAKVDSIVEQLASADPKMGVSAMYNIFHWNAQQGKQTLQQYAEKLRNINGAPTEQEQALHDSVSLIAGVGHFVAQIKPKEFNQALEIMVTDFQAH